MLPSRSGSFRLFRFAGVQVYLHWIWFLAAWYFISSRNHPYSSLSWKVAEYLSLFAIVLLHEFGHALACRQTGGAAEEIVLWPLGGIAFVKPPPRAGAELWSIAAGPLVNVALAPLLWAAIIFSTDAGFGGHESDFGLFLREIAEINLGLLIFNLLPIFPLDGGQIVRSLLWFKIGRARSLLVATLIGFVGLGALGLLAGWSFFFGSARLQSWSLWTAVMVFFMGQQCYAGFRHARALRQIERLPKHPEFTCPSCHESPPGGPLWRCASCGHGFDPFSTQGVCPHCTTRQAETLCPQCGTQHPVERWSARDINI